MIKFKKFISIYEGGANHKKFPFPAFLFLILILSSSFFISCENSITQDYYSAPETKSPEQITENKPVFKYADFTGRYTSRGALPSEINSFIYSNKSDDVNDGIKSFFRSAMPVNGSEKNEIRYYAIARAENEADVNGTVNETERTFSIPHLKLGIVWTVEVGIQVKNIVDGEEVWKRSYFAMEELPMLTESLCHQEKSFALKPDTEGSGSIDLNMTVDSSITSVEIRLSDEEQRNRWDAAIAQDPNKIIDTGHIKLANLQTGSYDLTILFKKASENFPSYTTNQTINVLNGMVTDRWFSDGTLLISDTGTFELTSTMISDYVDSCIYVGANLASASVSNNNEGKAYSPLETLQEAINRIRSANQSRHYTIFVSGNVTGAVSIEGEGAATFPSTAAASITIIGLNGLDANNYPRDCINGNGSAIALKINTGTIKVNIKDLQISGASGTHSACLKIESSSDVTLNAGVLIGSAAANPETRAVDGILNNGKLRINGSKILGNQEGVTSYGDTSYLEMSGGKISNNNKSGVYFAEDESDPGKVNARLYGTEISNNGNLNGSLEGGGVYVEEGTVTQFYNCTIKNNEAYQGGGIYSFSQSLSINNCQIENNHAKDGGGGIWIQETNELILSNTTIKNNIADCTGGAYGGALYTASDLVSFKISGNIDIPYGVNGVTGSGKNDVGLTAGRTITISGSLTCQNPIVLIPYPDSLSRRTPLVDVDNTNVTSITPYKDCFALNTNDWLLKANSADKALILDAPIYVAGQVTHPVTGKAGKAAADGGNGTKSAPFATIDQAVNEIIRLNAAENYTIYVDGEIIGLQTISNSLSSGKASSLTIQGASGNTSDILNRSGLGSDLGSVLTISSTVPVTIKDLRIKGGNTPYNGGGINMISGSTVTLESGALIGGTNESDPTSGSAPANSETASANYADKGGGIYSEGNLTLKNGSAVIYNYAYDGGGICCNGGSLTIEAGAKVNLNGTYTTGGGITTYGTELSMTGGEVCNNISNNGAGGLYITKNSSDYCPALITISGATISGNSADDNGSSGGIYYLGGQTLAITGNTEVSGNHCKYEGGGIRIMSGVLDLSDCTISGNYSNDGTRPGGGIAAIGGSIKLSGSVYIPSGATKDGSPLTGDFCNDVTCSDDYPIKIKGALTPPSECTDGIIATITPSLYIRGTSIIAAEGSITNLTSYKDNFALTNAADGWELKLSSDNSTLKLDAPIYVKQGGSSSATGSKSDPFDSINHALSVMTNKDLDYRIYIDGEVTGFTNKLPFDLKTDGTGTYNAKSILITGAHEIVSGSPRTDILAPYTTGTSSLLMRIMEIYTQVPVTITNLKITGGDSMNDHGGGIYLYSESTLTLGDDALIEGNNAGLGGNIQGGGVYVDRYATLNITGNAVVSGNTIGRLADRHASNVYLDGGVINITGALVNSKDSTKKANIGVSTSTAPTLTSTIAFTTNYGTYNTGIAPGTYFTGDQWTVAWGSGTSANEAVLAASGGSITIEPIYEDITISINKSSVLKSATEKKFTFTATGTDSEGNSSPITIGSGEGQLALTIDSVTYHGEELTESTHYTTGANYVTLDNSLPAGNYTINTRAVYQGSLSAPRTYSAGFEVKIVNGIQVTASNIDSLTFESGKKYYLAVDSAMTSSDLESLVNKIRESPNINDIGDSTLDLSAMELPAGQLTTQITLNNANITEIIIPDSLTSLWGQIAGQFQNNKKLITVTYNGTNRISWNNCTFQGCTSLKNFPWHALDTFLLGNQVFGGCTSLESVTIPADIEQICPTFDGCSNLKEVHFLGENPPYMQDDAFADCHPDLIFYVPSEAAREAYLNFTGAVSIDSSMKGFANPDVNPYATTPENLAAHVRVEGQ